MRDSNAGRLFAVERHTRTGPASDLIPGMALAFIATRLGGQEERPVAAWSKRAICMGRRDRAGDIPRWRYFLAGT